MQLEGLHHVTCVCSDAQQTLDFYRQIGLTLVKKTVNFDDPHSYHLYFGDDIGRPGTLLTFFEWPRADRGRLRPGAPAAVRTATARGPLESLGSEPPWVREPVELQDPDGLVVRLVPGEVPRLHDVVVIGNPD